MMTQEKLEEYIRQSRVLFAGCDATFAQCRETFARCEEHIRYLQDDSELKRVDKLIEQQQKRIDALVAESSELMKKLNIKK